MEIKDKFIRLKKSKGYTLRKLPTDYTTIKPFVLKTNDAYVVKRSISDQEVQNQEVSKPLLISSNEKSIFPNIIIYS